MTLRLASVGLLLGAALADATGHHALAYYFLVTAVPVVAVAALSGLGDVLDGSASEPHDRGIAMLSALVLPFVLLGTAVRAPLLEEGPPPTIGVTAIMMALAIFAIQALVRVTALAPRGQVPSGAETRSEATL
jgi:hypothetical protein